MKWVTWGLLAANLAVAGFFIGGAYWSQSVSEQRGRIGRSLYRSRMRR